MAPRHPDRPYAGQLPLHRTPRGPQLHSAKWRTLYDELIRPVLPRVLTRKLGIVANGPVASVSFAGLDDGGRPLSDFYALFMLPTASWIQFLHGRERTSDQPLIVPAPGTTEGLSKHAREEVEAVARLLNGEPRLGLDADASNRKREIAGHSIVHVAAPVVLDAARPMESAIVLGATESPGSLLRVGEIAAIDLRGSDLVVLTRADETSVSDGDGEAVIALTRALMFAGTASVLHSQWAVDDESTEFFVRAFCTQLLLGASKAEALQAAQASTRARYPSQYRWAGFVLIGDPGSDQPLLKAMTSGAPFLIGTIAIGMIFLAGWTNRRRLHMAKRHCGN